MVSDDPLILGELARHYEAGQQLQALVETLEALSEATDEPVELSWRLQDAWVDLESDTWLAS